MNCINTFIRQLGKRKSYWVVDGVKSVLVIFLGVILCSGYVKTVFIYSSVFLSEMSWCLHFASQYFRKKNGMMGDTGNTRELTISEVDDSWT